MSTSLFDYSHAFGLSVCGVACGLITAMDLPESSDEADKTAGSYTLWFVFILLSALLAFFMFTLKYNANTGTISNLMLNAIPAGFSVVIGIIIYFAYYFQHDNSSAAYFTSLSLLTLNLLLSYYVVNGFENPSINPLDQSVNLPLTVKFAVICLLVSLVVIFSINISLQNIVENNSDIHTKSKAMFKWINILSIIIVFIVIILGGIEFYLKHKEKSKVSASAELKDLKKP